MLVVSDTTALTTLMKAGMESVLGKLFGKVVIPEMVFEELIRFHASVPAWCEVQHITNNSLLPEISQTIDPGEAEAICLALQIRADAILLDDRKGRREAESRGLSCLSLPAILLEAKLQGLIPSLKEALNSIDQRGNYGLKAHARRALLIEAGESD